MSNTASHRTVENLAWPALVAVLALSLFVAGAGPVGADTPQRNLGESVQVRQDEGEALMAAKAAEQPMDEAAAMAEKWGIEVTSIRLTANDHMIDFRYRVLDPKKAKDLFVRQTKPSLVHQASGKVLAVPETAKIGPLRNSNAPQQGKIYWMFFGNAGGLVHEGDAVDVVIGEFKAANLVVE